MIRTGRTGCEREIFGLDALGDRILNGEWAVIEKIAIKVVKVRSEQSTQANCGVDLILCGNDD
ncbi:MAG: hypothetical protein JSV84_11850 [Gemmatimonadota bacterium]|nr:MAG: hypothetical protein JSV84_11850 [Gemmatimonadota bacterium]